MKNRFIIPYSVAASILFIFALAFLGINLYSEYEDGIPRTQEIQKQLVMSLKQKIVSKDFSTISECIENYQDFDSLDISCDSTSIFNYSYNGNSRSSTSSLVQPYTDSFSADGRVYRINSTLFLLRPYSIFYYSRISFLIILIVTVITGVLIFYVNSIDSASKYSEEDADETTSDEEYFEDENDSNINQVESEKTLETSEIQLQQASVQTQNAGSSDVQETIAAAPQQPQPAKEETLPSDEIKPLNLAKNNTETPSGLFSPVTGLGWESYLLTRLDNEINRAIASEFDIAVFVIKVPGVERTNPLTAKICEYLSVQFQFKDLIFEYKDDSYVGLKISMTLDQALNFADKLHADINRILENASKCYIGISTRSVRMVTADRILQEADEALKHALTDNDSQIIAFRVNAEKYRKFVETE